MDTLQMLPPPGDGGDPRADGVRVLTPEEIQQYIRPKFETTGNVLPDPATSTFVGVIRGGHVVASLCLQVKLHAQPLIVDDGYASVVPLLVKAAEEVILQRCGPQWVYLFAPAGRIAQLAQTLGMQLEPWVVLSKLVAPETPAKGTNVDEIAPLSAIPVTDEEMEQYPGETVQ